MKPVDMNQKIMERIQPNRDEILYSKNKNVIIKMYILYFDNEEDDPEPDKEFCVGFEIFPCKKFICTDSGEFHFNGNPTFHYIIAEIEQYLGPMEDISILSDDENIKELFIEFLSDKSGIQRIQTLESILKNSE